MIALAYGATFQSGTAPLPSSFVMWLTFAKQVLAQLHLFRETWLAVWRRLGWASRGRTEFVERYVISTRCAYFLVLRWVPRGPERGVSDPDRKWHPTAEFFPSFAVLFSLQGNWEKVGPAALHRQTGISAKPRPGTGGGRQLEAPVRGVGSVGQAARRGSLRDGPRSMRSAGRRRYASFPLARKRAPTLHMHTPAESAQCTHARPCTLRVHMCSLWRFGLV